LTSTSTTEIPEGTRAKLARWTCRTGGIRVLERLAKRPSLTVIAYHRIGHPGESPYNHAVFDCEPEQLDEQLSYLTAHYQVAALEEAQEFISHPEKLRHPHVLITFDDGYLDNYQVAFPILKSHGVQGTFFLATGFVGTDSVPWWDQVSFMVRASNRSSIILEYPRSISIERPSDDLRSVIRSIVGLYKSPETTDTRRFLLGLEQACGVSIPHSAVERQFMNWQEAAEMARAGMAIGSHTHRHELLAKLSPEEQFKEVDQSRRMIEDRLRVHVDSIAYPVGSRTSFSAATWEALERAGYRTAFSYYGGANLPKQIRRFDVLRIGVYRELSFSGFRVGLSTAAVTGLKSF
jgi:peptidoglycan/xylan/chitin deacetylase (PgdA/CDA1 family)